MSTPVEPLLRSLVDEMTPPQGLTYAALRIVSVVARDPATGTCTIAVSGDTDPDRYLAGVKIGNPAYYPRVGDQGLALQNRSDYVLVGALNAKVGHVRLTGATDVTMEQLGAVNDIVWQTQVDDTDGIWAPADGELVTLPWPGVWDVEARVETSGGSAVVRRALDLYVGADRIDRDEISVPNPPANHTHRVSATRHFDASDVLKVQFFQGGGGAITLVERAPDDTPTFSATWQGPG